MRILFFGDSIVQGFWGVEGGWVERIRKHYDSIAVQNLEGNMQPEIFNLGVDGDTTYGLLQRIENETKIRKWPKDPLCVVISIGSNDDSSKYNKQQILPNEFRNNLEKIITKLRPITDNIVLVGNTACDESKTTPVFWGDYYYTNARLQQSEQAMEAIASKFNIPYVPIFERFKDKLDVGENLLVDGVHPNDAGHQFIAELVLPTLNALLDK